jgi:predicted P-loop ATPase
MANHISPNHLQEWVDSRVNNAIIQANVQSLSGDAAYSALLYGLGPGDRRNDGRLRDRILHQYSHLDDGGWWCSGIDVLTGKDSDWGCFKPDRPRTPHQKNKPIKYEHPKDVPTEIFALKIPDPVWEAIADYHGINKYGASFWEWVKEHPQIPIFITEGAKKAGTLLSAGYVAIALPGVNNGYRSDGTHRELIPQIKAFCQRFREFVLCFDQDKRFKTRQMVANAIVTTGTLLRELGSKSSVLVWNTRYGKGIDDFIAKEGEGALGDLIDARLTISDFEQKQKQKSPYLDAVELVEFMNGEFEDRLSFDDLRSEILLDGEPMRLSPELKAWFVETFGYRCATEDLISTFSYMAKKNRFNPVTDYLKTVRDNCDRIRIDNLASRYFGLTDPLYNCFVRKWLIGAVARAFSPGCKFDNALILQGPQDIGKSTFFRILGGAWFDDSIEDISKEDSLLILDRCWIQELGEFERITSKRAAGEIKVFITRQKDVFRKKYEREASDHPRRCALCGSVNKSSFLLDETGNRRFWILPIPESLGKLNLEWLEAERDGIWASAVDAYLAGEQWWLTPDEAALSRENNKLFDVHDEWESEIEHYLTGRDVVSVAEILESAFALESAKHDRSTQMRVSTILVKMGWEKAGKQQHQGKRQHIYKRALNETDVLGAKKVGQVGQVGQTQSPQAFQTVQPPNKGWTEVGQSPKNGTKAASSVQPSPNNNKGCTEVGQSESPVKSQPVQPVQPVQPFSGKVASDENNAQSIASDEEYLRTHLPEPKQKEGKKYEHPAPIFQPGERVKFEDEIWEVERASHTHATIVNGASKKVVACWQCERV